MAHLSYEIPQEDFMKKQALKHFAVVSTVLGLLTTASVAGAQVRGVKGLAGKRARSSASQAPVRPSVTSGSPSYAFTLLNYPGQLLTSGQFSTDAVGINKGATTSKVEIVGGYGYENGFPVNGFVTRVSGTKTVTETYKTVNDPHGIQQQAYNVNDLGQIVGSYEDASGSFHGYELSGGKFTEINVPFTGASDTFIQSINDSGEIIGGYTAENGDGPSFTLIGGTYTSFEYPGSTYTEANDVNDNGDIVGEYYDASGGIHGFLLSGGIYTTIDFPGAFETQASGINDAGDIVGVYCTTSACEPEFDGAQGFLFSGGVYTTFAIPNEFATVAVGINNNGVIVGWYQDAAGVVEGFMATP
jgi:hypothetical protein